MTIRMRHLGHLLFPLIGVVYTVLWLVAEAGRLGNAPRMGMALQGTALVLVAAVPFVAFGIAIGLSRLAPAASLTLIAVTVAAQLGVEVFRFQSTSWAAYLPVLLAVVAISAFGTRRVRVVALSVTVIAAMVAAITLIVPFFGWGGYPALGSYAAQNEDLRNMLTVIGVSALLGAAAWAAGAGLGALRDSARTRGELASLERELTAAEAELTVANERERLARDVHDIMAHSLAIVAAQADGARMSDDALPERTSTTLTTIAETARSSLGELRQLLESAGSDSPEAPTTADLGTLAERIERAGHRVDLSVLGDPRPLSPTQDTMLYRIVQESLTNALKHAGAEASTRCSLDWRGPGVALLVETAAPSSTETVVAAGDLGTRAAEERESEHGHDREREPAPPLARGRGIRGMEERARLAGGWLVAGPDLDEPGRFVVQAFVPTAADARDLVGAEASA